jgi:hypothetical protein
MPNIHSDIGGFGRADELDQAEHNGGRKCKTCHGCLPDFKTLVV